MTKTFLKAEWRKLIMVNYAVNPKILKPFLPYKTEIDYWHNICFVSLVGFLFKDVKVKGIAWPFHTTFEEVNLRFYVRYKSGDSWKRGVVFIKEIVPKPAISFIANTIYKENYETRPMLHEWIQSNEILQVSYSWKKQGWQNISVEAYNKPNVIFTNSEEEFITEHYWGYARYAKKITNEYEVAHPKWKVYPLKSYQINVDFGENYGSEFSFLSEAEPKSVFLAEGSEIEVKGGIKIT